MLRSIQPDRPTPPGATPRPRPGRVTRGVGIVWALVGGAVAAGLVGCSERHGGDPAIDADRASVPSAGQPCSAGRVGMARTVERRPLVLADGTEAYVEPMNLMRVGSDLVVVGSPTYTWEVGGTRANMASYGAHLAAYLDPVTPRLVEMPVDVPAGVVRSIALGDRRWGALFSEADPEAFSQFSEVVDLWYAEYDGEAWSEVERLPLPDGLELFVGSSSALVSRGDAIGWVVVTDRGGAAVHYEREGGAWRYEIIEERGMEAAAQASGSSGVWMALSGVDPDLPAWTKTLRLFRWASGWQFVSRVATVEAYTEIRDPFVTVLPEGVTVTWREVSAAGSPAMARVGVGADHPGELLLLDPSTEQAKPIGMPDGSPAWVVQHVNAVTGLDELRLLRIEGPGTHIAQRIPYPLRGFYAALATGPDEVLVTGSEFNPDPAHATVRSLTLRLSSSCQ